ETAGVLAELDLGHCGGVDVEVESEGRDDEQHDQHDRDVGAPAQVLQTSEHTASTPASGRMQSGPVEAAEDRERRGEAQAADEEDRAGADDRGEQDRKSTRLNSSH